MTALGLEPVLLPARAGEGGFRALRRLQSRGLYQMVCCWPVRPTRQGY